MAIVDEGGKPLTAPEEPKAKVHCPACNNVISLPAPLISLVNKPTISMVIIQHIEGVQECSFCKTLLMPVIPGDAMQAVGLVLMPLPRQGGIVTPSQAKPS